MDSLADHSFISRIINVADIVDQIIINAWMHRWYLLVVSPYYIFLAKPIDLLFILLISIYHYRTHIVLWCLNGIPLGAAAAFSIAFMSTCFVLPHLISSSQKDELDSSFSPVIIPGKTTHTRLFPKTHKFSYPYLLVAVPVGLRANVNSLLSLDEDTKQLNAWQRWIMLATPYKVDGQDYLERQECAGGLRGKLDRFLKSKDISPSEFPHAILITSPKFLGYAFNPASFWYLYSSSKTLSAMIIEVNNTFGEMRPYLIFNETTMDVSEDACTDPSLGDTHYRRKKLTANWPKDFHVSPFNSRKGRYSVKTDDPMRPGMNQFQNVDITVSLSSSKSHAKLVAKVYGEKPPITISPMTLSQKILFVAKWAWVPFATFPQILYEASRLYFNRALHVWERPEPLADTVPRKASGEEEIIEKAFREYLRWKAENSNTPLVVTYQPPQSMPGCPAEKFRTGRMAQHLDSRHHIEFKILTPLFYSRFVAYDHDFDAVSAEYWEAGTFDTDNLPILSDLFSNSGAQMLRTNAKLDLFFAKLIKRLRQRPTRILRPRSSEEEAQRPSNLARTAGSTTQHHPPPMAPLDVFIWEQCIGEMKMRYAWALARLFLAQRLFWGFTESFAVIQLVYRLLVARFVVHLFFLVDGV